MPVQNAACTGAVSVLLATSTLAVGVNLPARRVVIAETCGSTQHRQLTATELQQMAGRAGRAGIDAHGEVVICTTPATIAKLRADMQVWH